MTKFRIRELRAFAELAPESDDAKAIVECLDEIERLQTFTRRGETPKLNGHEQPALLPPAAKPDPKKKARGTVEEFRAFARSIELPASDGEFFFHKLVSTEWRIGSKPVKDWKAAIRSWNAAGYLPSQKTQQQATQRASAGPAKVLL